MQTAHFLRVLRFLRVTDEQNNLSLTNLALVIALVHVLRQPGIELHDLLAFVATIVGYQVKRFAANPNQPVSDPSEEVKEAIKTLEGKVAALQVGRVLKPGK